MRKCCQHVFSVLHTATNLSVRTIAKLTGIPRSSVQRYKAGLVRRNQYPESHLWERPEGYAWLCLLVFATVYVFGIMRGVGAESLSYFFSLLHLQTHIGISPSVIRTIRREMESHILRYQQEQETEQRQQATGSLEVCVGADETFFHEMLLVFMDLSSGYLFVEEAAQNRTYETWKECTQRVLSQFGITVKYVVSDRAKALIKLATDGFECLSIPDLFHASREISKLIGSRFHRKLQRIQKHLAKATVQLALLQKLANAPHEIDSQQRVIDQLRHEQQHIAAGLETSMRLLQQISLRVHPFVIATPARPAISEQVQQALHEVVEALKRLIEEYDIKDSQKRLTRFANQIEALTSVIDTWWLWVEEDLQPYDLDDDNRLWLCECLLPTIYWHVQADRTKQPALKMRYQQAADQALAALHQHPLTANISSDDLAYWQPWAEWMVSRFQRTSSAVEGRNGYLSQMHHNGRGIPSQRLQVLTVIHNFGLTRPDNTTAAQRLFDREFPNLFEWLVKQMKDLPLPRKARSPSKKKLLSLQPVPA
jgi:hypothetical protein